MAPSSYESLSHSKWDCKYHLVFIPKYRKKVLYGKIRKFLGPLFRELARQRECEIIEGHMVQDHVHMLIKIPPKHSVSSVIGYIKGKSAIAVARQFGGKQKNFNGAARTFLAYRNRFTTPGSLVSANPATPSCRSGDQATKAVESSSLPA